MQALGKVLEVVVAVEEGEEEEEEEVDVAVAILRDHLTLLHHQLHRLVPVRTQVPVEAPVVPVLVHVPVHA